MHKPFPFTLGADPEFNVVINNRKANAHTLIQAVLSKEYKATSMGFDINGKANIGWDGCDSTGEIRPSPANTPHEIVENLRAAFQAVTAKVAIFDFITHSKRAPVGGHIHLLLPQNTPNTKLQVIHNCMSAFYMPLLLCEDIINMKLRVNDYGLLSDYRVQNVSEKITTYEFRAPSAEWLTTPKIAEATLAYMGVVYHEILKNGPEKFAKEFKHVVWKNGNQADTMQQLFLNEFTCPIESMLKTIVKAIKKFEYYQEYKQEIDYLLRPKSVLKDKHEAKFNIMTGWKLNPRQPSKKSLLNQKAAKDKAKDINMDLFSRAISLQFNDDKNVNLFAEDFKDKIIAHGWKLKNAYFFYGLKKGVEKYLVFNKSNECFYHGGQIQTVEDAMAISEVVKRMSQKFALEGTVNAKDKKEQADRHVLVGIPYQVRIDQDFKSLISLVYDIEHGTLKPAPIEQKNLIMHATTSGKNRITTPVADAYKESNRIAMVEAESGEMALRYETDARIRLGENHNIHLESPGIYLGPAAALNLIPPEGAAF